MSTTDALDGGFEEAERGLDRLEKLKALQTRSASDQAAYEVAGCVMKLRAAVTGLTGDHSASQLSGEPAQLVEVLRQSGGR